MARLIAVLMLALAGALPAAAQDVAQDTVVVPGRWSEQRINSWYDRQPWLVGANYVPRNAANQLEMWQAETFSPEIIDQELGWAQSIGMNTMRVFLHDIAWREDPEGFLDRVDRFLAIAERHDIRAMLVIFDDVWNPQAQPGAQPEPRPHLHNSAWVQSPGRAYLGDPAKQDELEPYVKAVLGRFGQDPRVLAWDLYNEPGNMVGASYGVRGTGTELRDKPKYTLMLLEKVFRWARDAQPSQPVSAGVFWHTAATSAPLVLRSDLTVVPASKLHPINQFAFANSDFINWHNYDHVGTFAAEVRAMQAWNRPLFLTEYLARDAAAAKGTNRFEFMLPVAKAANVAMYNWGLVDGKTQTKYPWETWEVTWTKPPKIWHHDIFEADGTPYDPAEIATIRYLAGSAKQ